MQWNQQSQGGFNINASAYVPQQNDQDTSPQQCQQNRNHTPQSAAGMQDGYNASYNNALAAHGSSVVGATQGNSVYFNNSNNVARAYETGGYVHHQGLQPQEHVPTQSCHSRFTQHQQRDYLGANVHHGYEGAHSSNNATDIRHGAGANPIYENVERRGRHDAVPVAYFIPQQQQPISSSSSPLSPNVAHSSVNTAPNITQSLPKTQAISAAPAKRKGGAILSLGAAKPVATTLKIDDKSITDASSQLSSLDATAETEAGKATNEETQMKEAVTANATNDSANHNNSRSIPASPATSTAAAMPAKAGSDAMREAVRKEIAKQRDQSKKQFVRDPRPHFNVVFCGHVDAGKSTISGHLLMEKGLVDQREMDKLRREAEIHHREGWEYAYVMDVSEEERSKGITRETGAAYFETDKRRVTVLDAPGHKAFVPSMIGGATQADICVLVISSRTGEFETGFEKGGQTREHAMLVRTCGVKQMICVINKMDEGKWCKERYDHIVGKLKPFLRQNGYDEERAKNLIFIPVAGLTGDNLIRPTKHELCSWYNGPTMMDVIDELKLPETRSEHDALCIPLAGSYKDDGKTFMYGKVESGSIAVGEKIQILPNKQDGVVEGISIETTEFEKCYPGDNVHLRVRGIDESDIHAGYVATSVPTTLRAIEFFQARVVILDVRNILSAGSRFMLHIHSAQEEATFGKLFAKLDKRTGQITERDPACVRAGDSVIARIDLHFPLVCEAHKDFDKMGRFMLRDDGKTIAIGLITKLYESTRDNIIKSNT